MGARVCRLAEAAQHLYIVGNPQEIVDRLPV
jgi:hypothetical protein